MSSTSDVRHQQILRLAYQVEHLILPMFQYLNKLCQYVGIIIILFYFQSGHVWGNALETNSGISSPTAWGWWQEKGAPPKSCLHHQPSHIGPTAWIFSMWLHKRLQVTLQMHYWRTSLNFYV